LYETKKHTYTQKARTHTHTLRKQTKKKHTKTGPSNTEILGLGPPGDTRIAEIAGDRKAENEVETNNSSRAASCKKIKRKLQWSVFSVRWRERAGQNTVGEETGNLVGGPKVLVREREREREIRPRERERERKKRERERGREKRVLQCGQVGTQALFMATSGYNEMPR
jgi:hypothetical protein